MSTTEKGKKPKKVKKGKNTGETDLIDRETCETKTPSTQSITSELPTRYTDGKLDIAENEPQGNDNRNIPHVTETRLVSGQNSQGIPDGTSQQIVLMMQMFQQMMQSQQQQSQQQAEGQAQMMQMMKVLMNERPMVNVPSPPAETNLRIRSRVHTCFLKVTVRINPLIQVIKANDE